MKKTIGMILVSLLVYQCTKTAPKEAQAPETIIIIKEEVVEDVQTGEASSIRTTDATLNVSADTFDQPVTVALKPIRNPLSDSSTSAVTLGKPVALNVSSSQGDEAVRAKLPLDVGMNLPEEDLPETPTEKLFVVVLVQSGDGGFDDAYLIKPSDLEITTEDGNAVIKFKTTETNASFVIYTGDELELEKLIEPFVATEEDAAEDEDSGTGDSEPAANDGGSGNSDVASGDDGGDSDGSASDDGNGADSAESTVGDSTTDGGDQASDGDSDGGDDGESGSDDGDSGDPGPSPQVSVSTYASVINASNVSSSTVSGTCNQEGEAVVLSSGATNLGSDACENGAFSLVNVDLSSLAQGAKVLDVNHVAAQTSVNILIDTVAPAVAVDGASNDINGSNQGSYAVSGTCDEEGADVDLTVGGSIEVTIVCASGSWTATGIDTSALADGSISLQATIEDSAENSTSSVIINVTKDTNLPTITITPVDDVIDSNNEGSVSLSGTCTDDDDDIDVTVDDAANGATAAVDAQTTCSSGSWSVSGLDLSSLDPGSLSVTVDITDETSNTAQDTASLSKTANDPPSFAFTEPDGTDDFADTDSGFTISWTDSDADSDANITLYALESGSQPSGPCSGTILPGVLYENDGSNSLRWIPQDVNLAQDYYLCAKVEDGETNPVETWSSNPIQFHNRPSTAARAYDFVSTGSAWSFSVAGTGGAGPYTYAIEVGPSGSSIDGSGSISYTPSTDGHHDFFVTITDSRGISYQHYILLHAYSLDNSGNVCVWTGSSDDDWATSGNWTDCGGGVPGQHDRVIIDGTALTQPLVSADASIEAFAPAATGVNAGGTVSIDAAVTLTIEDPYESFGSDVKLQGSVSTCGDCTVRINPSVTEDYLTVTYNATLKLGTGLSLNFGNNGESIRAGDGYDWAGHIETDHSGASNEFPALTNNSPGFMLLGPRADQLSSIDFDGLEINLYQYEWPMKFFQHYSITQINNLTMNIIFNNTLDNGRSYFEFLSCPDANSDFHWEGITLTEGYDSAAAYSVDMSGCQGFGGQKLYIEGSGTGLTNGEANDNDPDNMVTWGAPSAGDRPTITLDLEADQTYAGVTSSSFDIPYTAADTDSAASIGIYYKENTATGCDHDPTNSGWTLINSASEDDGPDTMTWNLPDVGYYRLCAKIDDSITDPAYAVSETGVYVLPSMIMWVKADTGLTVDAQGRISNWADQSGSSHHLTQSTDIAKPKFIANTNYGLGSVRFSGAQEFTSANIANLNASSEFSVVSVFSKSEDNADFAPILSRGDSGSANRVQLTLGGGGAGGTDAIVGRVEDGGASFEYATAVTGHGFHLAGFSYNGIGGDVVTLFNRADSDLTATTSGSLPVALSSESLPLSIGGGDGAFFRGDINEVMVFDNELAGTDYEVVMDYFEKRWFHSKALSNQAVAANADNGTILGSSNFLTNDSTTADQLEIGLDTNERTWGFFRIPLNQRIPAGAEITSATFSCNVSRAPVNLDAADDSLIVYLQDDDDVPAIADKFHEPEDYDGQSKFHSFTQRSVRWPESGDLTDFDTNGWKTSPDISALVQELVDRHGGLSRGAHIGVWLSYGSDLGLGDRAVYCDNYDKDPAYLDITFRWR